MLTVSLFHSAKRFFERRRTLTALRRQERYHFAAMTYHVRKGERDIDDRAYHENFARFRLASLRRVCDEQRMLKTGQGFWQLYDLDSWAAQARDFQREGSPQFSDLFHRVPITARSALYERVRELRWEEERASAEAYCSSLPKLTREEALADFVKWVEGSLPGPLERKRWCPQLSSGRHLDFGA